MNGERYEIIRRIASIVNEFGNKVSIFLSATGVILGAQSFRNEYDGHTIEASLAQVERLTQRKIKIQVGDRGYRGKKEVDGTLIEIPDAPKPSDSRYQKRKKHKLFCKRAGIEPTIGHLKSDYRLGRNFYKGVVGDAVTLLLAAAAYIFKRAMRALLTLLKIISEMLSERAYTNGFSLSCFFKGRLYTEADEMDIGYFVAYNLKVLEQSFQQLQKYIKRKQEEKKAASMFLRMGSFNERQAQIIKMFDVDPNTLITIKDLQVKSGISPTTAKTDIIELLEKELISKITLNRVKRAYIKGNKLDELLSSK